MNKKMLYTAVVSALPFLTMATGCATLTRGTTEAYQVVSDPPGALVTLSTGETCSTPCTLAKKRDESFLVTIEKAGYEPYRIQVNSESCDQGRLAMVGNLLLIGSVFWASIDSLSGATQQLSPNPCRVKLAPTLPSEVAQPDAESMKGRPG
jgi:hypothetical protein